MSKDLVKCTNCNGTLIVESNKKVCPYCGAEYPIEKPTPPSQETKTNEPEIPPAQALFEIYGSRAALTDSQWETFEKLCVYTNGGNEINDYYNYFKLRAENSLKSLKDCAIPGVNDNLMDKIMPRISSMLTSGESIIFYRDRGVLSRAKTGMLLTDKRIFIVEKRKIYDVKYKDIEKVSTGKGVNYVNQWIFNDNADLLVDTIGCNNDQLGVTLAFICEMAKQHNSNNDEYKIIIEFNYR